MENTSLAMCMVRELKIEFLHGISHEIKEVTIEYEVKNFTHHPLRRDW